MKDIQYGYLVTKDTHNESKVHSIHFLLNPVTKAVCLLCNEKSELIQHIKLNQNVMISLYNSKQGRYTRLEGNASISTDMLCDFERGAYKTLNPQAKKTEALVYVEMNRVEVLNGTTGSQHRVRQLAI